MDRRRRSRAGCGQLRQERRRRWAAGLLTSAFVVGVWLPVATLAQAPPAEGIAEIIVTARKIEENLQDVPMSVQALSGDFLDEANLTRLYELQFNTPGLVVNNAGLFGAGFALRGISDQGGSSVSVATHLNGVYLGNANLAIARMFDLERIEVLKGPQGTLYGRNATGGSINFITQTPQDDFSADIEGAYGSYCNDARSGSRQYPDGGRRRSARLRRFGGRWIHQKFGRRQEVCRERFLGTESFVECPT